MKDQPHPGLGTLNRLFMAAELLHLNKTDWSGLRLGLIEELEAHLHPQAQMQVIESLQKQDSIQLILTTHSPNLASKLKLENLIICKDRNAYPMGKHYTKLAEDNYKFLEKFLDTTKANLFFAKGVILVEGWAEEILIPSIAKNIGINLTEKGVSIVNIGHTGFDHYTSIYLRKLEPSMTTPVAVVTDVDIQTYEKILSVDIEGKPCKDAHGKNQYKFEKIQNTVVDQKTASKISDLESKSEKNIKYFITPEWTLEYALYKSTSLSPIFKQALKSIHTDTPWDVDFERELAKKLLTKGLEKPKIAYLVANAIDEDLAKFIKGEISEKTIQILIDDNPDDSIAYLVKAIRYASGN